MSVTIYTTPSPSDNTAPSPSDSPNPTDGDGGSGMNDGGLQQRGANYFFGFLITFVVLLLIFVACGIGSRRRFLAGRQRAGSVGAWGLDGMGGVAAAQRGAVPWTPLGSDGYGNVRYKLPELYEKTFVPGYGARAGTWDAEGKESGRVYDPEDVGVWRYMAPLSVALCRQRPTATKEEPQPDAGAYDDSTRTRRGSGIQPDVVPRVPVLLAEPLRGSPAQGVLSRDYYSTPNASLNANSQAYAAPPAPAPIPVPPPPQQPQQSTQSIRRQPHPRGLSFSSWLRPHPTVALPSHRHHYPRHQQHSRRNNNILGMRADKKIGPPEALQIAVMIVMPQAPRGSSSSSSSSPSSSSGIPSSRAALPTVSPFTIGSDKESDSASDGQSELSLQSCADEKERMSSMSSEALPPPAPSLPGYDVAQVQAQMDAVSDDSEKRPRQRQRGPGAGPPLRIPEYQIGVATVPWQTELFVTT